MYIDYKTELQRVLDLAFIILLLPFWLAVGVFCFVLVWLSDPKAPVFYNQKRVGYNGVVFRMWKFRTMVKNAEELKHTLRPLNERIWPDFKMRNDPRITRLGRVMRRTSLDELPQIYNVIRGDMSLVGPRPTSFSLSSYQTWHTERLEVKPGLTGYWQVKSRNTEFNERVRLDIKHVRHNSIKGVLMLLILTIPAAFNGH